MTKKYSVVIPTYNNQFFIGSAIKSAVNQTLSKEHYDIIVVDDGSSDNTEDVVKDIISSVDFDIKYFKKPNGGTASARNFGINKSTAENIAFLDADDTYTSNKLLFSLGVLEKYPGVSIVYSDYVEKYVDKNVVRMKENFSIDKLFKSCIISTNSVVRRKAIDIVGGFDEKLRYIEDYDLWCRIVMSGAFAIRIPEILFLYTSHPASKTNSTPLDTIKPEWTIISNRIQNNEWYIK